MNAAPAKISDLLARYDGFLVDAYGVLNDSTGALPGAASLVAALRKPWLLLTNDASRLPATIAARLTRFGVPVAAEQVCSSGTLIAPWFAANRLHGRPTTVLGTEESRVLVAAAGGAVVEPGAPTEIVVVADDAGYPFLETVEATINACTRALDAGTPLRLLLPNPDLLYPRADGVGLTAGAVAVLIETALERLRPGAPRFVGLGKPHAPIYDEARRRLGPGRLLAIGDSIDTDVAGALAAGLDVAYLASAVGRWRPGDSPEPTYLLASIAV
jgi:ribonucleotide monophosphatase NagD (HAD superfamily)